MERDRSLPEKYGFLFNRIAADFLERIAGKNFNQHPVDPDQIFGRVAFAIVFFRAAEFGQVFIVNRGRIIYRIYVHPETV